MINSKNLTLQSLKEEEKLMAGGVTGFADAESCFRIVIWKDKASQTGGGIRAEFSIELHTKDLVLLSRVQFFSAA